MEKTVKGKRKLVSFAGPALMALVAASLALLMVASLGTATTKVAEAKTGPNWLILDKVTKVYTDTSKSGSWQTRQVPTAYMGFYPDGSFKYVPKNVRTDLVPITGRWSNNNGTIKFQGTGGSVSSNGSSPATVAGELRKDSKGNPVAFVDESFGSGLSATVNNTSFVSQVSSRHKFEAAAHWSS